MENIAEPLALIILIRRFIYRGSSIRKGIEAFLPQKSEFSLQMTSWIQLRDDGKSTESILRQLNPYRRTLLQTLERGLDGASIQHQLEQLEVELIDKCEGQIADHTAKMPFKLMIPLFLFIFPAFFILLLGPLLVSG